MVSWLRGQGEEARERVSVGDDGNEVDMSGVVWLGRTGHRGWKIMIFYNHGNVV